MYQYLVKHSLISVGEWRTIGYDSTVIMADSYIDAEEIFREKMKRKTDHQGIFTYGITDIVKLK